MSQNEGTKEEVKATPESEKILADIEALQKGETPPSEASKQASEAKPSEPEPTQPEKATQPTVEKEPTPKGKVEETQTPADKKEGKSEVDIREWAKRSKINIDDPESVLKAYREMQRKLSQVQAEKRATVPHGTPEPQVPAWQPQPQVPAFQPQYQYPPQHVDRSAIIAQEAARFNMTPEDLERLLPLVNEVTDLKLNRTQAMLQAKYDAQLAELNRGNKRNAEFNELMADPLFTKPEVAFEIDKIMSENPGRLQLEPTPWTNAFKEALERIARKQLQTGVQEVETVSQPTNPPKQGGRGTVSGNPSVETQQSILERFKKSNSEDMQKTLIQMGALQPPEH